MSEEIARSQEMFEAALGQLRKELYEAVAEALVEQGNRGNAREEAKRVIDSVLGSESL